MPQADKRLKAQYVFDTSGPVEQTRAEVKALVDALRDDPDDDQDQ
jgi:ABC-type uncharacterized transport system auxiliary subunit